MQAPPAINSRRAPTPTVAPDIPRGIAASHVSIAASDSPSTTPAATRPSSCQGIRLMNVSMKPAPAARARYPTRTKITSAPSPAQIQDSLASVPRLSQIRCSQSLLEIGSAVHSG